MIPLRQCLGLATLLALLALPLAAQPTEVQLEAATGPMRTRLQEIRKLRRSDPKAYVREILQWVDEMDAIGRKFAAVSQASGTRSEASREMESVAAFVRDRQHDAKGAIELYRKAEALTLQQNPRMSCCAMSLQIADIYQFDLGDAVHAALLFEGFRSMLARVPADSGESAPWFRWQRKWLDAEIAFLRKGQRFTGTLTPEELEGFMMQLYYGASAVLFDDPEEQAEWITDRLHSTADDRNLMMQKLRSPEFRQKVLADAGSHTNFLRKYAFAKWLEKADAAAWLKRNDPAGFWAASLLTLVGLEDAMMGNKPRPDRTDDLPLELARTPTNDPTAFALLAREYAKTHPLPKVPARR